VSGHDLSSSPSRVAAKEDSEGEGLLSIGSAAAKAGVTERSLRYYQELGLICPSALTKGGMRRYSQSDLERVGRIRDLQTLLGLNLEEIARVLRNEDRTAEIRAHYKRVPAKQRRELLTESLQLANELRELVETKRSSLQAFVTDLDGRINRIQSALDAEST